MSSEGFKGVPGVPEGWELLEVRHAKPSDWYLGRDGEPQIWTQSCQSNLVYCIIRKIEKPKKYRPFANGAEFKPHRDRWWKPKTFSLDIDPNDLLIHPPQSYNRDGFSGCTWQQAFNGRVFDDGTPFGVEVTE
jgi:hypothetical protein